MKKTNKKQKNKDKEALYQADQEPLLSLFPGLSGRQDTSCSTFHPQGFHTNMVSDNRVASLGRLSIPLYPQTSIHIVHVYHLKEKVLMFGKHGKPEASTGCKSMAVKGKK